MKLLWYVRLALLFGSVALLILALFVLAWAELAAPGGGRYFPLTNFDLYANIMVISEVWLVVSIGILNIQPDGSPVSGFIGAVVAFPLAWNHLNQEAGLATIDDVNGWDLDWEVVAGPGIDVALVALFLLFVGSALASLAPYSPEPDSPYLVSPLAVKLGRIFTDHGLTARQYDSIVRMHQDLTAWSTADDETSQQATEALSELNQLLEPTVDEKNMYVPLKWKLKERDATDVIEAIRPKWNHINALRR